MILISMKACEFFLILLGLVCYTVFIKNSFYAAKAIDNERECGRLEARQQDHRACLPQLPEYRILRGSLSIDRGINADYFNSIYRFAVAFVIVEIITLYIANPFLISVKNILKKA